MRRHVALPLVTLLALAACGAETGGGPESPSLAGSRSALGTAAPPAPAPRDDGRLPATVTPQRYALALRVDPTQARFSGTTSIQVAVPEPTWNVVMHARDMSVTSAVAHVAGAPDIPATASTRLANGGVVPEKLVLAFARPLPQGQAVLEISYDAPFAADLAGLYRVKEGDAWYAYTQFEATDARRAFPCFDEPGFKTAYDVSITTPRGMLALSNAPESSHEDAPDGTVYHFETSRPLPSYLVAFAVGDFDVVQGQTSPFPIRAVTPKGKGGLTSLALEASAALVGKLGEYFDVRYPYPKLDIVAVPDFRSGAMENPGLVTFREERLLIDPARATTSARRSQAMTIAHEFAHQWFGDLVTAKWWDDIWLNEGMATWAESKMVDAWKPSFGATTEEIAVVQHVMDTDALHSARAVRQPVHSVSEAEEAFDGLTYAKGAAVLRMLESWLGADTFRRGVQRYVHANAWGNASANDLFDALDFVSAQKVGAIASDFLEHPGVPAVLLSWKCGGKNGGKLELRESEWRPLGGGGDPPRSWKLPVCVASDGQKGKSCFTLGADPIARDLGAHCPAWLYPNADEAGYYRFVLDRAQLLALARVARSLDPVDRLGLVSNAWAEVRQGALEPSALFEVLPTFDGEMNRFVVDQLGSVVEDMDRSLVDDGDRPAFRRWVAARFAGKKAMLGWEPAKKEDDDRALARQAALLTMGNVAHDPATLAEAEKYAQKWLKDPTSIPSETAMVAVPLASIRAGASRLDELRAAAKSAKTAQDRIVAIRAMAWFDDPTVLRQAFDLGLTDEIRLGELRHLYGQALDRREAVPVLYGWEKDNWGKVRARIHGSRLGGMLVRVAGAMCTKPDHDDAKAFFEQATVAMEGIKRPLEERLEEASLCAALREHGGASVATWLKGK